MESKPEERGLSAEELEAQHITELPDREALTTIDPVSPPAYWGGTGFIPAPEPWEPDPPIEESM